MTAIAWMSKVQRYIFTSRCFLLATRYSYKNRQVVPSLRKLTQRFLTPVVPPVLALAIFSWSSEPKMEATKSEPQLAEAEAMKHADELYESKQGSNEVEVVKNIHAFLTQYRECANAELLWRLARACRDLANLSVTDQTSKRSLIYEAHEYAQRALAADEENYASHKWYAITLSDVGDYEATKQKISNAFKIQSHFKRAIELNSSDATCYHLLGRWCFTVAGVPWYERKIASLVFDTPPSSTYEEAIEYFEQAERVSPNFYSMNQLMIAKAYNNLSKKAEARQWLEKLSSYDAKTEEDKAAIKEATDRLKYSY